MLIRAIGNSDVIVCDELGPMEFRSQEFVQCAKDLLKADEHTIVVAHRKLQHPIIDESKRRASLPITLPK